MYNYHYSNDEPEQLIMRGCSRVFRFDVVRQSDTYQYLEVSVPTMQWDYNHLVSAIVRARFSADDIEAILLNDDSAELAGLQDWRDHAKSIASQFFGLSSTLEGAKREKLREIDIYDKSSAVNGFYLQGQLVWLDKATRVGLMNAVTIAKASGKETMATWFGTWQLELNCDAAIAMLSALEMYAMECYNVTAQHKAEVEAMTEIEAVTAFDVSAGYPEQLSL